MLDQERFIKEYHLHKFGSKGWYNSIDLACPMCGRNDKFGVRFFKGSIITNCFYCEDTPNGNRFLRAINRPDLITNEEIFHFTPKMPDLIEEKEVEGFEIEEKPKPPKFHPIIYDPYLKSRGFTRQQYDVFHVGKSDFLKYKDYVIFLLYQQQKLVGWLARSKLSKEWHENNLKEHKLDNSVPLVLRYRNSLNTDFTKILGGYDEISENTKTVWLVEGLMDKANLDRLYDLYNQEEIKCCFTFGNKVSEEQIYLLKMCKLVKNIVILYDYGTIDRIKKYGLILSKYFNVKVGEFKNKEIDAGEASIDYMEEVFVSLKDIFEFNIKRLG